MNNFFAEIGINLADKIEKHDANSAPIPPRAPIFKFSSLELIDVANLIRDLRPSTSCGVDGLTSRILKACGPTIFPVILYLFNLSLTSRIFLSCWKTANVTPSTRRVPKTTQAITLPSRSYLAWKKSWSERYTIS